MPPVYHPCHPAGGQAARAEQLFDRLCSVCKPDASTFNCLVCVYCRLGKVREAANMLEIMLRSGQHVDVTTFDAAIDACWATGVVPLQHFAQQLLERAQQQGLYQTRVVKQVRHAHPRSLRFCCQTPCINRVCRFC